MTVQELKEAYIDTLKELRRVDEDYSYINKQGLQIEEIVTNMLAAIERNVKAGGHNAWLPYNKALKIACKKIGIKKDQELRALFA